MKKNTLNLALASLLMLIVFSCKKQESASMSDANYESAKAVSAEASASTTDSISSTASTQVKGKEFVKTASVNMEVKDVYDATIK